MATHTYTVDTSTAVVGIGDCITPDSHAKAMTAQWNKALGLAADIVEQCGHISADLAVQRIRARMDPPQDR
jgi:hypothetical protein